METIRLTYDNGWLLLEPDGRLTVHAGRMTDDLGVGDHKEIVRGLLRGILEDFKDPAWVLSIPSMGKTTDICAIVSPNPHNPGPHSSARALLIRDHTSCFIVRIRLSPTDVERWTAQLRASG